MIIFRFGDDESIHNYDHTETTDITQVCKYPTFYL